ncbi:MAG TPA: DUF4097 family beta strand repeat-containing protein [Pyrinomonadaceae bacterium]|jgi:DUF4097 and DUF4098 domain-containing protein YvlB|nr:DUF4097 family beta strand repeat-containing protein [Pyrinomonadaceae bacterium]
MSRKILNRATLAVGVLLLACGGAFAQGEGSGARDAVREEFHQSYPLSPRGRVTLKNISGAVRITAWDRAEVRVDAVKRAETRERLDEARISVDASADSVNIETRYPDDAFKYERGDSRRRNAASVDYTVSVPRGARLEAIEVISGRLDIENVEGGVKASCISGQFTARNLTGEAKLSNVSGTLEASFDKLDDASNVTLGNVSGQIILRIPSDTNGTIKANTLSGQITNNLGLPVRRGEYVGHDMSGQLGNGGARIKLNNVSGQIKIQRAADGRTATSVTNLITDARQVSHAGASQEEIERRVEREIESAMRDTEHAERTAERATRLTEREVRRAARATTRDAAQTNERALRAAERATRDLERNQAQIEREVERAAREIEQALGEHERTAAEHGEYSYRLVERDAKSFNVSGTPRVRIDTFDGSINIQPSNESTVRFSAVKRARDEQAMRGIRLRAEQTGDTINIIAEFDRAQQREDYGTGAAVALDVWVPRNANVTVKSGDGRLRLSGIEGDINLHTGDGSVDVTESKGHLRVETGDGRVRVVGFDGDATVQTGDGRISLDGRFTKLTARTGDGAISLALPANANARIETDSERVINDASAVAEDGEGEATERRVRRWRIGSGAGSQINLRTGDGQIFLRRTGDERE